MKTKEDIKQYLDTVGFDCNHFNPGTSLKIGGIYLQQHIEEYTDMLYFLLNLDIPIDNILEVGSASGGNAYVLANIFKPTNIVIIDDNTHHYHQKRYEILKDIQYKEFIGNSQGREARKFINDLNIQFDFVYIDADHSYTGVTKDFYNFKDSVKLGGYLGFHDAGIKGLPEFFNTEMSKDNSFELVFDVFHRFGNKIFKRVK